MTDDHAQKKVGVIGLGKMGSALADSLLAKGFEVTVWNRTPVKAEPLVKAGAKLAGSVADAARSSNVLVACLTNYAAVKTAVMTADVGPALRSRILVDTTGMRSEGIREVARWADANGISFLKGSILTYPDDVRAGKSCILYGGARGIFDDIAPVLRAMGGGPVHIGDNPDDGDKMALAYCCFLYPALVAFLDGAAVCYRAGISIEAYARSLILPLLKGTVLPSMLERLAMATLARRYDEDVQATLNIWNETLDDTIHDTSSYRLNPGLLSATRAVLDRAAAQGFGEQDIAAVFEVLIGADR